MKQVGWQSGLIVAIAVVLAIGVNFWRGNGIALVGDWSEQARLTDTSGESLIVPLELAQQWFKQGAALFVDARPESQYVEGHIAGALNLPAQETDRYFMALADRLESAQAIVTYCDGETCELSHDLALFLKQMGFETVLVLVNGWSAWRQAGMPTEAGN